MEGMERRDNSLKRMAVIRPVSIFAHGRNGILRGKTRDISAGGCSITLDDVLEIGEKVLFRIELGDDFDPAIQSAEVVWKDPSQKTVGVKFITDDKQKEISEPAQNCIPESGSIVKLGIEKMEKPLRVMCKQANNDYILLRTNIPFLETPQKVTLNFEDANKKEHQLSGTLSDVSLEKLEGEPSPFITLKVQLNDHIDKMHQQDDSCKSETIQYPEKEQVQTATEETTLQLSQQTQSQQENISNEPVPQLQETGQDSNQPQEVPNCQTSETFPVLQVDDNNEKITPPYIIYTRKAISFIVTYGLLLIKKLADIFKTSLPAVKNLLGTAIKKCSPEEKGLIQLCSRIKAVFNGTGRLRRTTKLNHHSSKSKLLSDKAKLLLNSSFLLVFLAISISLSAWGLVKLIKVSASSKSATDAEALKPPISKIPVTQTASQGAEIQTKQEISFDAWKTETTENLEKGSAVTMQNSVPSENKMTSVPATSLNHDDTVASATQNPVNTTPETSVKQEVINMEDTIVRASPPSSISSASILPSAKTSLKNVKTEPPREEPPPAKLKNFPSVVNKTLNLPIEGNISGIRHYPLKQPPGLVIDVKGVRSLYPEGKKEINGPKVKSLKVINRGDSTRFIIIFNGQNIPSFEIVTHKNKLEVKF